MGLFGKKKITHGDAKESDAQEKPVSASDLGVVIHVMPKELMHEPVALPVAQKTEVPEEPKPQVAPPVPLPVVPKLPLAVPGEKKARIPLWMWILVFVLVLFVAGSVSYVIFGLSKTQEVTQPTQTQVTLPVVDEPVVPVVETPIVPKEPTLSLDSDSDGLTDIEERMYGTDYRNPDSDGDTFLDGNEVFHRYDPMGLAPSTLLDTGTVKMYTADATAFPASTSGVPFSLLVPVSWKVVPDNASQSVTFQTPNIASFVLTWSAKDPELTVEDWLLTNVKSVDLASLKASYTKEGYYVLRTKDDLVAYVDTGSVVYVMTYDLGTSLDISYIQTFAMMLNSLSIGT